jgi:hypothetical protein
MGVNLMISNLKNILKLIYKGPFFYKKAANKLTQQLRNNLNFEIIKIVFNDKFCVHNGPFKGLKYISESNGSNLLSKILGSYEEPIQEWIKKIIEKKYHTILNIGCAEGYYAVGFGMKMPNTRIIGYDIDPDARSNAKKLIKLNNIKNISIKSECTFKELTSRSKKNTLIFCDIEGSESVLLNPIKVPNLQYVDLLIESHDFLNSNITEMLINRFYQTHKITIVVDYPFRLGKYLTPSKCKAEFLKIIFDENRPKGMKWLFLESIYL